MHFSACTATSVECVYVGCLCHLTHGSSSPPPPHCWRGLFTAAHVAQDLLWLFRCLDHFYVCFTEKPAIYGCGYLCILSPQKHIHTYIQHFFTIATDSCALIWILKKSLLGDVFSPLNDQLPFEVLVLLICHVYKKRFEFMFNFLIKVSARTCKQTCTDVCNLACLVHRAEQSVAEILGDVHVGSSASFCDLQLPRTSLST